MFLQRFFLITLLLSCISLPASSYADEYVCEMVYYCPMAGLFTPFTIWGRGATELLAAQDANQDATAECVPYLAQYGVKQPNSEDPAFRCWLESTPHDWTQPLFEPPPPLPPL